MKITTTNKKISGTLLISLTDVIFLLLIFLMLVSNFVNQTGIRVRLPGSTSSAQQTYKTLDVIYKSPQEIQVFKIKMSLAEFKIVLPSLYKSPDQTVRLVADRDTSLQELISFMDIIRQAGFEKISIATYKQVSK
jgi:biopolymer transport protein ExbD